ncbi:MAG: hypothetical protein HQK84_11880 [Nitrospinae bacterium]|nr:hypothetical protein [Nitrospinota bacterium]
MMQLQGLAYTPSIMNFFSQCLGGIRRSYDEFRNLLSANGFINVTFKTIWYINFSVLCTATIEQK